jgi:hypothetical protein
MTTPRKCACGCKEPIPKDRGFELVDGVLVKRAAADRILYASDACRNRAARRRQRKRAADRDAAAVS